MSQAANIVLNDGTINRTFKPISTTGGLTTFLDLATNSSSAGAGEVTVSFSRANSQRPTFRSRVHLAVPREDVVDGVPVVSSIPRAHIDLIMPDGMTATDRTEFKELIQSLVANAVFDVLVADLDPPY